ncbi:MAG TPA: hypothetical protein DCP51_05850 [Clostridiales bacterium]|nr:hypothetical protein [Clostridiales bacterium]HCT85379.1 hypothetical protein [Candidatus Margulisiibacteriota bacterium]
MEHSYISEIEIIPIRAKDGLIAFASVLLDKKIKLGSIGIFTKLNGGVRLTYPTKGMFNIFNPITKELSQAIEKSVIEKLNEISGGIYDADAI